MKNGVILLKMRLWAFLTELPPIILLLVCIRNNSSANGLFKLYPLILVLMALIIFLSFYFFRLCEVSWEEIRDIGLFTRRDDAIITEGTALSVLITPKRGQIKLVLLGKSVNAGFDWVKPTDTPPELPMYRGNVYGGERAAKKLLSYFGAEDDGDIEAILGNSDFRKDYRYSTVTAESTDEGRLIRIDINETLTAHGTPLKKPGKAAETAPISDGEADASAANSSSGDAADTSAADEEKSAE